MTAIMVGGTSSSAGKSLLVAAICRILSKKGYDVAPFKAQNMSLNSYVTKNGKEIAIAQAYQAFAAGIEPDERMNPVLLKPKGDHVSQLVVMGEAIRDVKVNEYWKELGWIRDVIRRAYTELSEEFDVVVIEGAGGMAEINLYDKDVANIFIARVARPRILIVGDIDRGGVFSSLFGTYKLLPDDVRELVVGFVINKLRGRSDILASGIKQLETMCGVGVLGVIPHLGSCMPSEDSLNIEEWNGEGPVGIIKLPRISNFTDFEPIKSIARFIELNSSVRDCEVLIIPGSKNSIADLAELKRSRIWNELRRAKRNCVVIGICGGYQILGKELVDFGVEHGRVKVKGLGLLDAVTVFRSYRKKTMQVEKKVTGEAAILDRIRGKTVWGYEIHKGVTFASNPVFEDEGCASYDGMCWGTYLHGLFWNACVVKALGSFLGVKIRGGENWIDVLADEVEKRVNIEPLLSYIS